uniref:C2H2-type domain-containing protein n=1 Tax=Apteryx owenii TaxID=8824 RepID=A0A8B9NU22_APTOW
MSTELRCYCLSELFFNCADCRNKIIKARIPETQVIPPRAWNFGLLRPSDVRSISFNAGLSDNISPPLADGPLEAPGTPEGAEDKCKSAKSKPFRCKPCQYEAESEEEFVHHIRVHSAKKFFVEESAEKQAQVKESDSCGAEEVDFSKGPIRCDRCGYNTNRYDHYLAHLKHHNKAGENERVYKCTICTYTTVSEYHWKKHLRNHFPRKVYTCSQCSYFSDRKNNYIQHIRTHTGERPYQCAMCPYSSSQKTHLTRHMRTHSGWYGAAAAARLTWGRGAVQGKQPVAFGLGFSSCCYSWVVLTCLELYRKLKVG